MDSLSDEAFCARFLDSPYVQLFCGETHFQHALPLNRSSMTRLRQRIGAERLELLLAETLATAERTGAAEPKHFERVSRHCHVDCRLGELEPATELVRPHATKWGRVSCCQIRNALSRARRCWSAVVRCRRGRKWP